MAEPRTKNIRTAKNIVLNNVCPNCERRIWEPGDTRKRSRLYSAPAWFRQMFKEMLNTWPLGEYYVHRCEVCGLTVAVFNKNRGFLADEAIVVYACSMLSVPLDTDTGCDGKGTCYDCEWKKTSPYYVQKG